MSFGLVDLWQHMGLIARLVVILLALMSMISMAVGVDRVLAIIAPRGRSRVYSMEVQRLLEAGKFEEIVRLEGSRVEAISKVVKAGVSELIDAQRESPGSEETLAAVQAGLDRALFGQMERLRRGLGALATIGSVAPFVGLFGTVVGIVNAFQQIAKTGSGGLGAVSGGIAEALVTTAMGILVAIPSVVLFNYFTGQLDATEARLRDAGSVIVDFARKSTWASHPKAATA